MPESFMHDERHRLRKQSHDRAQFLKSSALRKRTTPVDREFLPVGLHEGEILIAAHQRLQVVYRSFGRLGTASYDTAV